MLEKLSLHFDNSRPDGFVWRQTIWGRPKRVFAPGLFMYLSLRQQVVVEQLFKKTGILDNHGELLSFLTPGIINPALIAG